MEATLLVTQARVPAAILAAVVSLAATPMWPVLAQRAAVRGALVDVVTQQPIEAARISILGTTLATVSGRDGGFELASVPTGVHVLQVRAIGYALASWVLDLAEGQSLRQNFELQSRVVTVDSVRVVVASAVESWRNEAGFETRRRSGRGYFITREEIARRQPRTLADLMRNVPGIGTVCRGGASNSCRVVMNRGSRPCSPDYFLDGFEATASTGPNFPINQIRGIEIYGDPSMIPLELQRPNLRCGVIAIWTIDSGTELGKH